MLSLVESAAKKEDEKVNKKLAKKVYSRSVESVESLFTIHINQIGTSCKDYWREGCQERSESRGKEGQISKQPWSTEWILLYTNRLVWFFFLGTSKASLSWSTEEEEDRGKKIKGKGKDGSCSCKVTACSKSEYGHINHKILMNLSTLGTGKEKEER